MHKPGGIAGLLVTDAAVGERIDAQRALYVEGSDENPCFTPAEASPREPGVEYDRTFDRCLPSLIAFKEESAARTFQVAHGGRILTYAQALKSVMQR
jgi:nitrous oxide reductase accessory protein NosL